MRLSAPDLAPKVLLTDTYGNVIEVGNGKRTLLAFFRDAACPFCNMRVYQLTRDYDKLKAMGLEVIAVFASTPEEVQKFVLNRPRPFKVAAEPTRTAYDVYGIQYSFWRKLRAVVMRMGAWLGGMSHLGLGGTIKGLGGLNTNNILPANFLIDEEGRITEAYYGKDAGDHIPMERIELFLARGIAKRAAEKMNKAA